MKKILSVIISLVLIISLCVTAFAAGGFSQSEYDKLKTQAEKSAYLTEVDKYYASKGWNVSADEYAAYTAACAELSRSASKAEAAAAAAALPDDAKAIIARIKENYGITIELGYNGDYPANAKVTQHLQGIESGMSYLGATFIKKLVKSVEDAQGLPFQLQLVPRLDTPGKQETSWAVAGASGITFYGYDSSPFSAPTVVHEFGHVFEHVVRGSAGIAPAPFGDMTGVERGQAADGSMYVKSVPADKFVSNYAGKNSKEDYAETFRVAIIGGTDKSYTGGTGTALYKKFKVIYDDLSAFAGADSRACQRVGGYLGIGS